MRKKCIVISLHKEWWQRMRTGEKVLEIRKTRPKGKGSYTVFVYIVGGVGVVGEFECDSFYKLDVKPNVTIWALPPEESGIPYNLQKASCLSKAQLEEYAGDSERPLWGWHITQLKEYDRVLSLQEIGVEKAPQSWCYTEVE